MLTIVIIGAATLLMAIGASRLGLGEMEMGFDEAGGSAAFALADGCVEESLERLRKDAAYLGETLNAVGGSCTVTVNGVGFGRTVVSAATSGSYTKRIEVQVTLDGSTVMVDSWREISAN